MNVARCLGVALAVLLIGCSGEAPPPNPGRSLHVVIGEEPANLDPARAINAGNAELSRQVFQSLYRYRYLTRTPTLRGDLAADLPVWSDDRTELTVRLRPDARFADDAAFPGGRGREVTAGDVIYSLQRHFDPAVRSSWRWLLEGRIVGLDAWGEDPDYDRSVEGLQAVDDRTLRIRLTAPFPAFAQILAVPGAGVVPREAVERYGDEFGRKPVGSGPYRLVHLDEVGARFERNPNFDQRLDLAEEGYRAEDWPALEGIAAHDGERLPLMDQVIVSFVVDNVPAFLMLSESPPPDVVPIATEAQALWRRQTPTSHRLVVFQSDSVVRFGFNLEGPLGVPDSTHDAEDLRLLRCAMGRAMDWSARNEIFYHGQARLHPGIIPPDLSGFEPDLDPGPVTHDPSRARTMLQEGGWNPDSLPTIFYGYDSGVLQQQGFEHFRGVLGEVGWPAERIQPKVYASYGALAQGAIDGEFDVYLRAWILDYPDAENVLALYYGPNAPGTNFERYRNPEYDRLYRQILTLGEGTLRDAAMAEMNRMLIHDCVFMGSVFRTRNRAIHNDLILRGDAQAALIGLPWRFAVRRADSHSP